MRTLVVGEVERYAHDVANFFFFFWPARANPKKGCHKEGVMRKTNNFSNSKLSNAKPNWVTYVVNYCSVYDPKARTKLNETTVTPPPQQRNSTRKCCLP